MKERALVPHAVLAVILAMSYILIPTPSCTNAQQPATSGYIDNRNRISVLQAAKKVVSAFKTRNGKRLAALVHPEKGVRFSPSAYIDVKSDIVFSRNQVQHFWLDRKTYLWGFEDGTGDPIKMTPSQYYRRYILNRDFLHPSSINVNNDRAAGNTNNNAASIYPNGIRVEYYIKNSSQNNELKNDWAALRLVFERSGSSWFLVGVIHDEWTI